MDPLLNNPVYYALVSGDAHLGSGTDGVRHFYEEVSPFVGFEEENPNGFEELFDQLAQGRKILYATRNEIKEPPGFELAHEIKGLQFVYDGDEVGITDQVPLVPLENKHVDEMITLARLTKPGPFDKRTIEFGHYYGVFDNGKLVAMTGQRLHVYQYTEISAVCTHPDYLGKGYAAALMQNELNIICNNGQVPFLHVRADNYRAIALYERLRFRRNGGMNFYFMRRR